MGSNAVRTCAWCALAMFMAFGSAHAQESVADLGRLQSETVVLRAKNARAAEEERLSEVASTDTTSSANNEVLPVVSRVSGRSDQATAFLLYHDGAVVPVVVGNRIRGDFKVSFVSASRVELRKGAETFSLGFSVIPPKPAVRAPKPLQVMAGPSFGQGVP